MPRYKASSDVENMQYNHTVDTHDVHRHILIEGGVFRWHADFETRAFDLLSCAGRAGRLSSSKIRRVAGDASCGRARMKKLNHFALDG